MMGILGDLLSAIDSRKRVLGSQVKDLMTNPADALQGILAMPPEQRAAMQREALAMDRGAGLLGSVMPGVDQPMQTPEAQAALNFAPMGMGAIRAFHGSPHKFDKFDLSKIGTGEGAQAYGWGGYVAESPGVAKQYAEELAKGQGSPLVIRKGGKVFKEGDALTSEVLDALKLRQLAETDAGQFPHNVQYYAKKRLEKMPTGPYKERVAKALDDLAESTYAYEKRQPQMYELNLRWPDPAREAADPLGPQHFLDWDKPVNQQPEMLDAIRDTVNKHVHKAFVDGINGNTLDSASHWLPWLRQWLKDPNKATGEDVYRLISSGAYQGHHGGITASKAINQIGIPGIRYLDGGSRGAGEGTANYVVFDDKLIEILKRNGVPVGLLGE